MKVAWPNDWRETLMNESPERITLTQSRNNKTEGTHHA
jgi:hypothetical protein